MKEIVAFIQPYLLSQVTLALTEIPDFPGMSVSDCEGFGREYAESGHEYRPFLPKKRIEIFTPDHLADRIFQVLMQAAHTGNPGDGKVYLIDTQSGGRIGTGETGEDLD